MNNLFLVIVTYIKPLDEVEALRPKHREYLKEGYKNKNLLLSGPHKEHNGKFGGILIARFPSKENVEEFTKNDPFYLNNVATYDIIEFEAVLFDEILKNYF
ncbi:GTP cyclohydrolase [Helicobacter sp. 16-1353]|uniref:YciI family protein n=1 Tax=Helicobacter sp. 16-1353 TaxID=2004996 RepID=UPI000DCB59CC|nr:YciI family protein [Helicobacter sp. 16-1353]RAX54726.1 GTP cyclohydrolase [Helicobacter sp. 16-1353]